MSVRRTLAIVFLTLVCMAGLAWADDTGIQVRTEKPGVKIYIDDVFKGETAKGIGGMIYRIVDLSPGKHTLRCEYPGMKPLVDPTIVITDGQYLPYEVKFETPQIQTSSSSVETGKQQAETGTLKVNSKPFPANIELDGTRVATTNKTLSQVAVGRHHVRVYFDNDAQLAIDVELAADQTVTITADFTATPPRIWTDAKYAVSFISDPPGALTVDGKAVGDLPKTLSLQNGPHTATIIRDGYRTWERQIDVSGITLLKAALEKIDYRIQVSSTPAGSEVQVDGLAAGATPVSVSVSRGKHDVRVSRDHYTTWIGSVTVSTKEQESVSASLAQTEFRLDVTVDPPGALVTVDGRAVGAGPWTGWLKPGAHAIAVSAADCTSETRTVDLRTDTPLPVSLARQKGDVSVTTNPPRAQVLVDGADAGTSPASLSLVAGRHHVSFSLKGMCSQEADFTVQGGKTAVISAELIKLKPLYDTKASFPGKLSPVTPEGLVDETDAVTTIEHDALNSNLQFVDDVSDITTGVGIISGAVYVIYLLSTVFNKETAQYNEWGWTSLGLTTAGLIGNVAIGSIHIDTSSRTNEAKAERNRTLWKSVEKENLSRDRRNEQLLSEVNAQVERENDELRKTARTTVSYR
jgi:hypothetical protein